MLEIAWIMDGNHQCVCVCLDVCVGDKSKIGGHMTYKLLSISVWFGLHQQSNQSSRWCEAGVIPSLYEAIETTIIYCEVHCICSKSFYREQKTSIEYKPKKEKEIELSQNLCVYKDTVNIYPVIECYSGAAVECLIPNFARFSR